VLLLPSTLGASNITTTTLKLARSLLALNSDIRAKLESPDAIAVISNVEKDGDSDNNELARHLLKQLQ
jgi:hypothetical protein